MIKPTNVTDTDHTEYRLQQNIYRKKTIPSHYLCFGIAKPLFCRSQCQLTPHEQRLMFKPTACGQHTKGQTRSRCKQLITKVGWSVQSAPLHLVQNHCAIT